MDELNSRIERTEERIRELGKTTEMIQSEEEKENWWEKMSRASGKSETIIKDQAFMSSESQGRGESMRLKSIWKNYSWKFLKFCKRYKQSFKTLSKPQKDKPKKFYQDTL